MLPCIEDFNIYANITIDIYFTSYQWLEYEIKKSDILCSGLYDY